MWQKVTKEEEEEEVKNGFCCLARGQNVPRGSVCEK
jgi:hypothetical protein